MSDENCVNTTSDGGVGICGGDGSTPDGNDDETTIRQGLDVIQSMIDIAASRLEGLRTQCATSSELTQQEIRALETKLVRMFSELLVTKAKLPERLPRGLPPSNGAELRQWLQVVGLSVESKSAVMLHVDSVEELLKKDDIGLRELLSHNVHVREEETRRLLRAMGNLNRCRNAVDDGGKEPTDLFWDSWDRHHHTHHYRAGASPRAHRSGTGACKSKTAVRHPTPPHGGLESVQSPIAVSPPEQIDVHPGASGLSMRRQTISPEELNVSHLTPSPSPPSSPSTSSSAFISSSKQQGGHRGGFPTTPPPRRKHQTNLKTTPMKPAYGASNAQSGPTVVCSTASVVVGANMNQNDPQHLTKSKSHESQLLAAASTAAATPNADTGDSNPPNPNPTPHIGPTRSRLHTEPSPDNFNDIASDHSNTLHVPRSPCTPLGTQRNAAGGHCGDINYQLLHGHRFNKKFKLISACDVCGRQMFFGLKCKDCKFRCHKDCEPVIASTCAGFKRSKQASDMVFHGNHSPTLSGRNASLGGMPAALGSNLLTTGRRERYRSQDYHYTGICIGPGTESAGSAESSCNSSTPSSPALQTLTTQAHHLSTPVTVSAKTQFKFPEVSQIYKPDAMGVITLETHLMRQEKQHQQHQNQQHFYNKTDTPSSPRPAPPPPEVVVVGTAPANGSATTQTRPAIPTIRREMTSHTGGPATANDHTEIALSEVSSNTDSDGRTVRLDSADDPDESDDRLENEAQWSRQNSVSLKEWDIPYEDINLMEKIGDGRFGTVHRAQWHGAVAIKILKEDYLDNEAFKVEVATFKKTRHENLVLFMGACIKPQAIVTSLCKGNTLYTHIHMRKDKFNLNKTTMVAQQISLGMGYLHARSITHKDLKTKNIFLENGKVIITDFGLFSATKLEYDERLGLCVPQGWLAYLAPEIMQRLTPYPPEHRDQLPFSNKSDIYAFGTIWYELLCGEFPFKCQAPEAIIFQVGRGMKQTLANLQTARDVKEILMICWAFDYNLRPDFSTILQHLEKLPKKRLARSPSHPVQLSRSAESVF